MGAEHTVAAILVISSYDCSGLVPRILYSLSASILSASFSGSREEGKIGLALNHLKPKPAIRLAKTTI